jgi:WD40 repeat protein
MLVLAFGSKARIEHLAFAPDGRAVVATNESVVGTSESNVRLWPEVRDGARAEVVSGPRLPHRAVFTDGGRALFICNFRLWRVDLTTRTTVPLTAEANNRFPRFYPSPDGRFILVAEDLRGSSTNVLALYPANDLAAGAKLWERVLTGEYCSMPHFVANGTRVVRREGEWNGGRGDQRIITYDAATGETVARSGVIRDLALQTVAAPNGHWVVGLRDTWLCYWPVSAESGTAGFIKNDSKKHFTAAAFHPSSKYLAVTSNDATVKVYETATWAVARTFTWDIGKVRSVAFSPDGTLAAAGSDTGKVVVWDVDL